MASFDRAFSASPVLIMPPQSVHQSPFSLSTFAHQASSFGSPSSLVSHPSRSKSPFQTSTRGRKRSRDDASDSLDDSHSAAQNPVQPSASGWQFGQKMWPTRPPNPGRACRSDEAPLAAKQPDPVQARPVLRSSKSQRLEIGAAIDASGPLSSDRSSPTLDGANSPLSTSPNSATQPVVDDFTLCFGIGWRLLANDSTLAAAVRGWARYIENHYPLSNVKLYAESKGLQSYLVTADQGWYLFDENLRQGRLVSKDDRRCIDNIKCSPPVFDGPEVLTASQAASASPATQPRDVDVEMS